MNIKAVSDLKDKEWSMGNGQCPECYGVPARWHGHTCFMTTDTIGHKKDCPLAAALVELGEQPLMMGDFQSNVEFESCINDAGFLGVRLKTAEGCERYRAHKEKWTARVLDCLPCFTIENGQVIILPTLEKS